MDENAKRYRPEVRDAAERKGLYRADFEHDACGVGLVADTRGARSHAVIQTALSVLERLEHRGGSGSDPNAGDGAGILIQLPHTLYAEECKKRGFQLPPEGRYGAGMVFLPGDMVVRAGCLVMIERCVSELGMTLLGVREVPTDASYCGPSAKMVMPAIAQFFVTSKGNTLEGEELERALYVLRRKIEHTAREQHSARGGTFYLCSLSSRTVVYKGLLQPEQLPRFFPDLADRRAVTALAVVHQRFSTNTFPSWERAHPYRMVAHNGEINTLRGNVNWMRARQPTLQSDALGPDFAAMGPVIDERGSDSGMFDNMLELLVRAGRPLPHALSMMIPEAWEHDSESSQARKDFFEYHASIMEPWDGPAAMVFTDGIVAGAALDRNGLRPLRFVQTRDGLVIVASEAGVVDLPADQVERKDRVQPGRMILVDTRVGRVLMDDEVKARLAAQRDYGSWVRTHQVSVEDLADRGAGGPLGYPAALPLAVQQKAHGYTREDLKLVLAPMATTGQEAVGSMGNDAALAVLSERPQLLFNYFKQLFAQVTNPPIDPLREELVMSLRVALGAEHNMLAETPLHARKLSLAHPVISETELRRVAAVDRPGMRARVLPTLFVPAAGDYALPAALAALCARADEAVADGATILVLSDRDHDKDHAPIPSLLAAAAVHHHLIRGGQRTRCSLVVDTGDAREVMHFCLLVGYGVGAVHPRVACQSVAQMARDGLLKDSSEAGVKAAVEKYLYAANKGILKVMSKMGISTLASYHSAQVFEALGLSRELIDRYFTGTPSRIEGIGLGVLARECAMRQEHAFGVNPPGTEGLDEGGSYQWRARGELHMYNPDSVASLQHAVRAGDYKLFKRYTAQANDETRRLCTLRGLLRFKKGASVPLAEVEPTHSIVKRFKTGAMSFGSISREAHETLAIAMNRLGGRSNSGEGGEDPARYVPDANGDFRRSAIKQVASGRFGVTSHYLVNADELQIKMAQGAKPGEGGQLPGYKVDATIAKLRLATQGVGLISPPPHHDIYSIEDLAQLIFDLKNANDRARISVKLVSEAGVGTVAAGVAKARADVILISGDSGGTGAAPLTSLKHAGLPWELGLAEAQQVLVLNGLRSRVRLETDGQLKTGRDVAIAALLGAEEFGFATAALVAAGCVMMRVCHLNTCPVGIATQDPELRKRFPGEPEHVINFMGFIAEELREIMAELGFRTVDEMVGRVEMLEAADLSSHWKARALDLSAILLVPECAMGDTVLRCTESQYHGLPGTLDEKLLERCRPALLEGERVELDLSIRNVDRAACTRLSAEISRHYGEAGLPAGTIHLDFEGTAGQSFCAFMASGVDVRLRGEANDHFGKGLSGGRVVVIPPRGAGFVAEQNVIVGNVALYGATGGEVFIRGRAGERFGVRNSGAVAVVEGVGDHGCEYMTRGMVVVLGPTGRNFAAGMSGGVAFVLDSEGAFRARCNTGMVELERPDEADFAELRGLILRHYDLTGSAMAWRMLSGWPAWSQRFVKVMPTEYRRALASLRAETAAASLTLAGVPARTAAV